MNVHIKVIEPFRPTWQDSDRDHKLEQRAWLRIYLKWFYNGTLGVERFGSIYYSLVKRTFLQ